MDIIKIFHEETLALEPLSALTDADARRRAAASGSPPYARLYLAGAQLREDAPRLGLTALEAMPVLAEALTRLADDLSWTRLAAPLLAEAQILNVEGARAALSAPAETPVLACATDTLPADRLAAVAGTDRRAAIPALRSLLNDHPEAVLFFPEPAHDGADWSLFAAQPLRDRLTRHVQEADLGRARLFIAPYRHARGEHAFYFEQWALDDLPSWVTDLTTESEK